MQVQIHNQATLKPKIKFVHVMSGQPLEISFNMILHPRLFSDCVVNSKVQEIAGLVRRESGNRVKINGGGLKLRYKKTLNSRLFLLLVMLK
jgi:hypothetical protein